MKILKILFPICALTLSCSHNTVELRDKVFLKKEGVNQFELIFDQGEKEEWVYKEVDSLSVDTQFYAFLFYGKSSAASDKRWYYVSGAPRELKKGWGNWHDSEFRKYRIHELPKGEVLYNNLKPTMQVWNSPH